ncbi:MAG: M91 family zinc metallopeptidase [Candidatus Competibacteraceae bacterium]
MRKAKRPFSDKSKAAIKKADDDFYKNHPEFVKDGKRVPLSASDPGQAELRKEWMDSYIAHGGEYEETDTTKPKKKPADPVTPCPKEKSSIVWKKQPGATDEDLKKAQELWDLAKTRRLPDGSKPATVEAMEALEKSDKTTTIEVGPTGNSTGYASTDDASDPSKGSDATIKFNPNKKGAMSDGTERDPESSLAHEAVHAHQATEGKRPTTRKDREQSASSAENEHRKAKGLPQRKQYGSWPVEQH